MTSETRYSTGLTTGSWTNPTYIASNDGNLASKALAASGYTNTKAQNFGFSIPSGATIEGVVMVIETSVDASSVISNSLCRLLDADGNETGSLTHRWGLVENTTKTKGSSTDLWDCSLTPAWVNDADFGVALTFRNDDSGAAHIISIDYITLEVFYTGGSQRRRALLGVGK